MYKFIKSTLLSFIKLFNLLFLLFFSSDNLLIKNLLLVSIIIFFPLSASSIGTKPIFGIISSLLSISFRATTSCFLLAIFKGFLKLVLIKSDKMKQILLF